jgi:hypothetical protein
VSGQSIAEIGTLLVGDLGAAFGVTAAPDKAMAFFQGVPVNDQIVDQQGVLNQLQLELWLGQFDTTLLLAPAQATIALPPGGASASEWYGSIVQGAVPLDVSSDAGRELLATLSTDQERFRQVNIAEPFECDPPDWPMPGTPYWTRWDSSAHDSTTTTTTTTPAAPGSPSRVPLMAGIDWTIRTDDRLPPITPAPPSEVVPIRNVTSERFPAASDEGISAAMSAGPPVARETIVSSNVVREVVRPDLAWRPGNLSPIDGGTTTATTGEDIVISFEYTLVTLRRAVAGDLWWDDTLLHNPSWYLPGFRAGALLAVGGENLVQVLPYAIIIARSAIVSGNWDHQESTSHVGPLLVSVTRSEDGVAIGWPGMQAIGLLATVLPELPPNADPGLGGQPPQVLPPSDAPSAPSSQSTTPTPPASPVTPPPDATPTSAPTPTPAPTTAPNSPPTTANPESGS